MKKTILLLLPLFFLLACAPQSINSHSAPLAAQADSPDKTQLLLLGTLHFNQFHDAGSAHGNFLSPERQQEIGDVVALLKVYKPDMILIERTPGEQTKYDSLFQQFKQGRLNLEELEGGTGEVYQFGFKLAKELGHERVYCVDYYESTSQSLMSSGTNIAVFENGLHNFQQTARGVTAAFMEGDMTFREFLSFLNTPETITLSHRQFFNLPAYVQNGSFRSYEGLNRSEIDTTQIGAEFISLFYERNLKIYSNLLNAQLKHKGKRLLLIMGQTHIGVLQDIAEIGRAHV